MSLTEFYVDVFVCVCVCMCVRACVHASNESKPGIDVADAVKDKKERKCWRMIRQKR